MPASVLQAARPWTDAARRRANCPETELLIDVELNAAGLLSGMVVDMQGTPVAGAVVDVRPCNHRQLGNPQLGNRQLASTTTDALGRFSVGKLRGGMYQVVADRQRRLVRAWTVGTAPPGTRQAALIVVGSSLVRGQMPLESFFASDAFVVTAMTAAMVGIPFTTGFYKPASP